MLSPRPPACVVSVNVGRPQRASWAALGETAMAKSMVVGPVRVGVLGIEGDEVADTRHHGGPDQAVYAFAREDLDWWGEQLGRPLPDGHFAENLTTVGIDVNEAVIGERWRIGTVVLEVCHVRTPCNDFKGWLGETGYDNAYWVKRFTEVGRPGPYLRVIEEGTLAAGDLVQVIHRPDHGLTVSAMFRALNLDRTQLPRLLEVEEVGAVARAKAQAYVDRVTLAC